ncbi:hypothetical protein U1Q18_044768 [Sarracenia purpurea var. burkii]
MAGIRTDKLKVMSTVSCIVAHFSASVSRKGKSWASMIEYNLLTNNAQTSAMGLFPALAPTLFIPYTYWPQQKMYKGTKGNSSHNGWHQGVAAQREAVVSSSIQ